MGVLKTKILSYSPEQYYPNDALFPTSGTVTNLGSGPSATTANWSFSAVRPTLNSTGGPDGSGCLQFSTDYTAEQFARTFSSTTTGVPTSALMDGDYSSGFWFRVPTIVSGSSEGNITLGRITGSAASNTICQLVTSGANVGKLSITGGTTYTSTSRYDDGQWHYYAERVYNDGSVYTKEKYVDGVLVQTSNFAYSGTSLSYIEMADNSIVATTGSLTYIELAHFYYGTSSSINATAISQIWTTGNNAIANVSVLSDVLTASSSSIQPSVSGSANINPTAFSIDPVGIEPTIITTTSNSVNIATSIPVDITLVQPASSLSIGINIGTSLDASTDMVNPVFGISTPVNIYETPMTASASLQTNITNIANKQVSYSASATTASATIVNPPTIISDDEVIIYADIMSASTEIPLPSFGTPTPDPLYWTPGTLKSKIATYAIELGTEFNYSGTNYSAIPCYGTISSVGWTSYSPNTTGYIPVYDATDGPYASGTGSWKLSGTRATKVLPSGITTDLNYTIGLWVRVKTLPTGTGTDALRLFSLGTSTPDATSRDFSISVTGSSHATAPSKLALSLNGTTYDYFGQTLNSTDWHYIAVRRVGSTGVNNFEVYVDGQLQLVKTNSDTSTTYDRFHICNSPSAANGEIVYQNFHAATATTLTSYEIDQIWQAGTKLPPAASVNVSHASDRFLATALSTSPTVIAVKGDHVEVTTSVTVSSEFPEPGWSTGEIVRINVGSLGTLQATIGDNVQIETNGDKSITPDPMLANAKFVEPILARTPFYANASLPMPVIYTAPNYFSLVKNLNPVFYIEDGQAQPVNYGSWDVDGWNRQYMDVNQQSTLEMNAVGNQKSWMGNANDITLHRPELQANIPDYQTKINNLYATRDLSIEIWYKSIGWGNTVNHLIYEESGPIFTDGITQIAEVWDWFGCVPGADEPLEKIVLIGERVKNYQFDSANDFAEWRTYSDLEPKRDQWNHLVVTYEPVSDPGKIRKKVYLNGGLAGNQLLTISNSSLNTSLEPNVDEGYIDITLDQPQNIWSGPQIGGGIQLSGSQTIKLHDGVLVDEFAIYPKALSATQVVEHYNFIKNLSPDTKFNATAINFEVESGTHIVIPQKNALFDEDPMPALASRIPEPVIIGGKSKTINSDSGEIDATLINPSIITESIHSVDAMIATSNLETVYVANNQYYNYVKTIPNLHRYYSFDTSAPLTNHGSDTTYSVPDIDIAGEIVQYGKSINNKSAMTAGVTPLGGVTLYESQHDDSWGSVGNGNFFTSFWMERPYFDFLSPGLRMVANINSPSNNHYVLLYAYAGQLWLDAWDGTNLHRQSTTVNPGLYNYGTHHVLIAFDNTNQNARHIKVYADNNLIIDASIGNMNLDFVNGGADEPNNSANNYPRMSFGSLITPFEITSLPAYPVNIRGTFDEIIWANTNATSGIISGLYTNMPTRLGSFNEATPIEASCESVDVAVSTGTTIDATPMLAFPAQTEPQLTLEYSIDITIDTFDATADINEAERSDSINVISNIFLATFALGSSGTPRVINATPLTASISLINRNVTGVQTGQGNGIKINGFRTFDPNSKWVQYVLSTTENTLIPMREVR